ncbi:O-antigen polymerase [Mycobacterium sp. IS-1742]|uniref:O-antigen polymerase n=1 Tax=Mycobacterium sp. IS-1742 TaxID=1772285 RepID=UPI001E2EDA1A|nr:O-antigen polymerase [Mycobacterium sp. IS-1742]
MRHDVTARRTRVWWVGPTPVILMVATMSILLTAAVGDERFRALWNTPKSVTGHVLLLMFCGALALAVGASAIGAMRPVRIPAQRWPNLAPGAVVLLCRASSVLVALTVLGYLGFGYLLARAGIGWSQIAGASGYSGSAPIKTLVGTIPGVTTMTQFGIAAVIVSSIVLAQQNSRTELLKIVAVVGMSVPRAFIFAERLAILELVVPIAIVACYRAAETPRMRSAVRLVPVVALPAVVVVFSVFEYFRSWEFFRGSGQSFWQFSFERVAGYYATAVNNGYLELNHLNVAGREPLTTLEFLWDAPGVRQLQLYDQLAGNFPGRNGVVTDADYVAMLADYGNPEFNNATGFSIPYLDYGTVGGLVFFLVAGVIAGLLYRSFREASPAGLLMYPLFFVGLIELPRYMHWTQGRSLPSWVALGVIVLLVARVDRRWHSTRRDDGQEPVAALSAAAGTPNTRVSTVSAERSHE